MEDTKNASFEPKGEEGEWEEEEEEEEEEKKATAHKHDSVELRKKLRKKSITHDDTSSEKKKSKRKGDGAGSDDSLEQHAEGETQKKLVKELSKTDKIKSFAGKGAAAKSPSYDDTVKDSPQAIRRREKSAILQSMIQPDTQEAEVKTSSRTISTRRPSQPSAPEKPRKMESEMMHEQLLKQEEEDQALATFVLDLVKKKRKEKEEQEEISLTEAQIFQKSKNMTALEQAAIICILEETVAKLSILGYTHGKPVVKPEIKYVSLLDKLAQKEESELVSLIKSNKTPEQFEIDKQFIKLQKDRGFLEEALTLTLLEMREKGTFKILLDIVHLEQEMIKEEADLRFTGRNRQQEVNHCRALLENERRKGLKKLDHRTTILAKLKDEIQNVLFYNGLKFKYMDHWEQSRAEQSTMVLKNRETDLYRTVSDFEEMSSIERRCSAEMKAFIEESIQRLTDKVEEWMDKYESDMEEKENKITKLKEEREEHSRALQETIDLFNERQKQMDDWKAYKERQRLEEEYQVYIVKMATRIQAWWRGTMVRNHLGPYRKKKGRKGKKKKK